MNIIEAFASGLLNVLEDWNGQKKFLQGIWLLLEGTNQAGQTLAISNLGKVTVRHSGGTRKLGNMLEQPDFAAIDELTAYLYGAVYFESAIGAAFSAAFWLPMNGLFLGESALYMGEKERMSIRIDKISGVIALTAEWQFHCCWTEHGETTVIPRWGYADLSAVGDDFDFPAHTAMIIIGDPGAANRPDDISIRRGNTVLFESSWDQFLQMTKKKGSYDGATNPSLPVIDLTEGGKDRSILFGPLKVKVKGGLGSNNTCFTYIYFDLDPVRHSASVKASVIHENRAKREIVTETKSLELASAVVAGGGSQRAPSVSVDAANTSAIRKAY